MSDATHQPAADTTQPQPAQAAAVPATQPAFDWESDANPWKKRSQGWQGKYQETDNAKKALEASLSDTEAKRVAAEALATAKAAEAAKLDAEFAALKTDAETAKAKLDRLSIVAKEFPGLLDLENEGALPNLEGDPLRAALTKLNAKITTAASARMSDALEGASVPPPQGDKPKTADDLKQAAITLVQQGKAPQAEIDVAWDKYYASLGELK